MINTKHLLKVASAWTSIVYVICFLGVAIYPASRVMLMRYAMHADFPLTSNYFGFGYFISGLIIWNVIALAGTWLFAFLFNTIKD